MPFSGIQGIGENFHGIQGINSLLCDCVGSASGLVGPATMPLVHKGPNPFVLIGEQTKQAGQQLGFCPLPQRHGWAREEGEGVLFW